MMLACLSEYIAIKSRQSSWTYLIKSTINKTMSSLPIVPISFQSHLLLSLCDNLHFYLFLYS